MKRLMIASLLAAAAAPAWAQHEGHAMPAPQPPAQKPAADPHAGHHMPEAPPADPHAGHQMPEAPAADPHAAHQMPDPPAADPHAGHSMPADPHAGHAMPGHAPGIPDPPVAAPSAAARSGPRHAADAVFGAAPMADAREVLRKEHGAIVTSKILVDQLETLIRDGRDGYAWDAQGWYGGDIHKIWLKSEGEGSFGESPEHVEVQALYSRALDPWFNLQAGVRHDFRPDPERTYAVLGLQGLAPYWFEVEGALFLSDKGDLSARFEAEYDQRLTQKLILQPNIEFDLAAQDVPEIDVGSGLSSAELGLRLRYEFVPEFAPYVGVKYERAFGDTARFRRAAGEEAGGWSLLVGLRTWF
ncbi:copper resistance protein B [Sphingomonas sp. LY54]|uniref:copper resistance protein B n=1 Tax=Sphingomonas sp. LY54 TaxID=3095343 RepID=UPI002D766B09|nr:copper resistance protein B [Sphingomonas sp. LY54]WRP30041.1 copper resistance protein B [Sphingomonas sp. LY54]